MTTKDNSNGTNEATQIRTKVSVSVSDVELLLSVTKGTFHFKIFQFSEILSRLISESKINENSIFSAKL